MVVLEIVSLKSEYYSSSMGASEQPWAGGNGKDDQQVECEI